MPKATQLFATIVTKNQPGDERSRLDRPDRPDTFRVIVAAGSLGWLAVVNPGRRTDAAVRELLRDAITWPVRATTDARAQRGADGRTPLRR